MNKKSVGSKDAADKLVKNIRRKTARRYSAEEKIRIILAGLRGEESIAALCRREGIAESLYYKWSKEFLEALSLKECVAELTSENRLLKKSMIVVGIWNEIARACQYLQRSCRSQWLYLVRSAVLRE